MLSAEVTSGKNGLTLTVKSDRRQVTGQVTVAGETAPFTATFPLTIHDDSARQWILFSDDGVTAVFTA